MSLPFIDPWSPSLHADLQSLLAKQRPNEKAFFLVDTAFVPGLHTSLPPHGQWTALFEGNPSDANSLNEVSPWLGYSPNVSALIQHLHRHCSGTPSLSVILSHESLSEICHRLQQACIAKVDGQRFNLRFPDTRRLPGIWQALTPSQRAALLGPATAWHFVNRCGQWSSLPKVLPHHARPLEAFAMTDTQFSQILDDCRADEMLFKLIVRNEHTQVPHSQKFEAAQCALKAHSDRAQTEDDGDLFERFEIELKQLQSPSIS